MTRAWQNNGRACLNLIDVHTFVNGTDTLINVATNDTLILVATNKKKISQQKTNFYMINSNIF